MKTKLLSLLALSLVLTTSTVQADTIYDNLSLDGNNAFYGRGDGFPQSRNMLGDDISTLAPGDGEEWQIDSVSFNMIVFGDDIASETFTDVDVVVTLLAGVVTQDGGPATAEQFANATILGSETFNLGDVSSGDIGANATIPTTVDFVTSINIGDGQDIGITFAFSDSSLGSESGLLSMLYRNLAGTDNTPAIGETSRFNFRDEDQNGIINGTDNFGFGSDARLRIAIEASVAKNDCSFMIGDINEDGGIDLLDVGPFVDALAGGGEALCQADINEDGAVDLLDVVPFVELLSGG